MVWNGSRVKRVRFYLPHPTKLMLARLRLLASCQFQHQKTYLWLYPTSVIRAGLTPQQKWLASSYLLTTPKVLGLGWSLSAPTTSMDRALALTTLYRNS